MIVKTLKTFQQEAIDSAIRVFEYAKTTLNATVGDEQSRATAIHGNGYLLIEAPTGAGKTLIAGKVLERMLEVDRIVWFWFAPFKGVVDQSAAFLQEQIRGVRLRTLADDRNGIGTRSGDVFVTTWQSVATKMRDRRSVRQTGEQNGSIDDLIVSLREQGFRIGVVVDEAHHGFHGETQAAIFFRQVLNPEYTVLITATPDDADLLDLQRRMQVDNVHRISVSRADAVESGLIKKGIKCVAWRTEEGSDARIDFEKTALKEGVILHQSLKAKLKEAGINLVPLLLVQATDNASVARARETLKSFGFTEEQIATHTSNEPDAGLNSLANDETREVLIFKMAVALGFDAPRAWGLVSLRAARDEDFGVQLVGRILRVHRRLQGKAVPEELKYGYVLLADPDSQTGIDLAGQRINQLQTAYATVSPTTVIVRVGNHDMVQQTDQNGQTSFMPAPPPGAVFMPPPLRLPSAGSVEEGGSLWDAPGEPSATGISTGDVVHSVIRTTFATAQAPAKNRYPIRADVPRVFGSQELPDEVDIDHEDCAAKFIVEAEEMMRAMNDRETVRVQKLTLEIFTRDMQLEFGYALPSLEEMRLEAQRQLCKSGIFDPRELRSALIRVLPRFPTDTMTADQANERANELLDVLLSQHPGLLHQAQRSALAASAKEFDTDELPDAIESEVPLPVSRCNVYKVLPAGMNDWEVEFVKYLDADLTGTVLWWHRNPVRKPWSINILLESGAGFYPDFLIGIKSRPTKDNGLLADTKFGFDRSSEIPKILAEHPSYGKVQIVTKARGTWAIAKVDPATGRAVAGEAFRMASARGY
jgi:type III restriction enzyme